MAVLCSFRACIQKQSLGYDTTIEETKSRPCVPQVRVLIQHFVAVTQVSARGIAAGALPRSGHDSCTHCGLPVFLAERLLVGSKRALYHRTCFRCARCSAQLTLANCYETEDSGFCCEVCPDEERDKSDTSSIGTDQVDLSDSKSESASTAGAGEKSSHRTPSLSDDEKSAESQLKSTSGADEYSALFESTVESFHQKSVSQQNTDEMPLANTQDVFNDLVSKSDDSPYNIVNSNYPENIAAQPCSHHGELLHQNEKLSMCQSTKEGTKPINKALTESDIMTPSQGNEDVNSLELVNSDSINSLPVELSNVSTRSLEMNSSTKEFTSLNADDSVSSIVKIRRMMFEGESATTPIKKSTLPKRSSQSLMREEYEIEAHESEEASGELPIKVALDQTKATVPDPQNCFMESGTKERKPSVEEKEDTKHPPVSKSDCLEMNFSCDQFRTEAGEDVSENGRSLDVKSHKDEILKEETHAHRSSSTVPTKPSVSPRKVSSVLKEVVPLSADNEVNVDYPGELNPFGDDEDQSDVELKGMEKSVSSNKSCKVSSNPFGSSDEDEPVVLRQKNSSEKPPRPPLPKSMLVDRSDHATYSNHQTATAVALKTSPVPALRHTIPAPASLNPFWSYGEEPEDETTSTPVPLPRTLRTTPEPSPRPRTTVETTSKMLSSSGTLGSTSSLSSMASNTGSNRRSKKPAPAPPLIAAESLLPQKKSIPPSPNFSIRSPHKRKSRPAPQPPGTTNLISTGDKVSSLDGRKMQKDEANRTVQAGGKEEVSMPRDKSTFGQWKRKKGPAPPRPLPQRRQVRAMPLKELKQELDDIEVKQQELERQGVKLEQTIRHKFDAAPALNESSMTPDVEDLVIQLFELVNEKNELFRKQAELMYLRRQQRLEEEHAELEYQIRCLMEQPERNKTDTVKAREEELIQRLVEVVERRNEIIECLEMDRIREAEEDQSIHSRLGLFAAKTSKDLEEIPPSIVKKAKKKKKEKHIKKQKDFKIDADKDIDEVEAAAAVAATKEKKSKKRWFL